MLWEKAKMRTTTFYSCQNIFKSLFFLSCSNSELFVKAVTDVRHHKENNITLSRKSEVQMSSTTHWLLSTESLDQDLTAKRMISSMPFSNIL